MKSIRKVGAAKLGQNIDKRLAAYVAAAGAVGTVMASEGEAAVVANNTVQPFGVNGEVRIDFNSDGQTDFAIDHDRVTLPSAGPTLDYLQIDKNDINGETNPTAFDPALAGFSATPFQDGSSTRNDAVEAAYVVGASGLGNYPAALTAGTSIGPSSMFDWQETNDFNFSGDWIRANRLIDEDATQIDQVIGGQPADGVVVPTNGPNFIGLGGQVRYLGLKMDLNNTAPTSNFTQMNFGWVGIRITNEADATGEVVGYAYETTAGTEIAAGVPEPGTFFSALMGGAALLGRFLWKRGRRQ